MTLPLVLALGGMLGLLLPTLVGNAQSAPDTPTITSTTPVTRSITIEWSAPANDGGAPITAYDLRYIRSDADSARKMDRSNWTLREDIWSGGGLRYTLLNLRRDTPFDLELRAVNSAGDGAWSATQTGHTRDHGDTISTASRLPIGSFVQGSIGGADDVDVFRVVVSETTDLWIYSSGPLDTSADLVNSSGEQLALSHDSRLLDHPLSFSFRYYFSAGAYYIKVTSYDGRYTGPYTIHAESVDDRGGTTATATPITLDSKAAGRINPSTVRPVLLGVVIQYVNVDVWTFTLAERTEVWLLAVGRFGAEGILEDENGNEIASATQGAWAYDPYTFTLRRTLDAGTYYLSILGEDSSEFGDYVLYLNRTSEPGSSVSTRTPLTLNVPQTGNLASSAETEYFSFELSEETYASVYVGTFESNRAVTVAGTGVSSMTESYTITRTDYDNAGQDYASYRKWGKLAAGTYHISTTTTNPGGTRYLIHVSTSKYADTVETCTTTLTTTTSDPWFGCQWNLDNTSQYANGAGQDINVVELWDATDPSTMGEGIDVAVVDDGINYTHEDLSANVLTTQNHNLHSGQSTIYNPADRHGTSTASMIASRDNSLGVRGVAPRASVYGFNLITEGTFTGQNLATAMTPKTTTTGVINNSFGNVPDGSIWRAPSVWEAAVSEGVTTGFGGKGVLYVFAGGNGHNWGDYSNLYSLANHYAVLTACSVNYSDKRSSYSEMGSNLWICAPSSDFGAVPALPGIAAADVEDRYTVRFGGTSAAAPTVSGVAALIRAADTTLTWRDVKLILAQSARKNDASNSSWLAGANKYRSSGESYAYSHEYGFGTVDAGAALALVDSWTDLPAFRSRTVKSSDSARSIPDSPSESRAGGAVVRTLTLDQYVEFIEFVQVNIDFSHLEFSDLRVELISPSGRSSLLTVNRTVFGPNPIDGDFRFGSARHLGEDAEGVWSLRVTDHLPSVTGTMGDWSITVYGHGKTPDGPVIDSATAGDQRISVDWSAPADSGYSDPTSYDIRYIRSDADDKSDSRWMVVTDIATDDTGSYEITSLEQGVYYDIQMRADNDQGVGVWSKSTQGHTHAFAATAPSIRSVTPRSTELIITWKPPATGQVDITQYDLRYIRSDATDKTTDANWTEVNGAVTPSPGDDLLYSIGGIASSVLTNGVRYDVQVRARNTVSPTGGPWSATMSGTPRAINQDPVFLTSETGVRSINENTAAGVNIQFPIRASDANGDPLWYILDGADAAHFEINGATGQIMTKDPLNHEDKDVYLVAVQVTDQNDANGNVDLSIDARLPVSIFVNDLNEPPVVSGTGRFQREENTATFLARYVAVDPDDMDTFAWELSGPDRGDFAVDDSGNLSFIVSPDFDRPADSDGDNKYEVTVVANDGSLRGTLAVEVEIADIDEPPVITGTEQVSYRENASHDIARYRATDPEGQIATLTLNAANRQNFSLVNGVLRFASPPDYEEQASYSVFLEASDGGNQSNLNVLIDLENLDEAGSLALSSNQPVEDVPLTATHTDLDGILGEVWVWERSISLGGSWQPITGQTSNSYTPQTSDIGFYLRVTVTYEDGHGTGKRRSDTPLNKVLPTSRTNTGPTFPVGETGQRNVQENASPSTTIGAAVVANDAENDRLAYSINTSHGNRFAIDQNTGQLRVGPGPRLDRESRSNYTVIVTAADPSGLSTTQTVTITVDDVNEAPTAALDTVSTEEDTSIEIFVLANDIDPENDDLNVISVSRPSRGLAFVDRTTNVVTYTPDADYYGADSFSYRVSDGSLSAQGYINASVRSVNDPPVFASATFERQVAKGAPEGTKVGQPVTASDIDDSPSQVRYSLSGALEFEIEQIGGQILVAANAVLDPTVRSEYEVIVSALDSSLASASTEVTIKVVERVASTAAISGPIGLGGGGGGGPPPEPVPSDADFDWNVTRDLDDLHRDNQSPTDIWSDGQTIWALNNAPTGADRVFAYNLETGMRVEDREFELDSRNRFSHGIWSDGAMIWVADSGRDKLFAYILETGERQEDRDIELAERNRDPRGTWSDGETIYVLDSVKEALFSYNLLTGEALAEYPLAGLNRNARGIWSDGLTLWVSDDGANRVFAYRIENRELERVDDDEFGFRVLLKAGNGDIRGIWSNGDILFAIDEQDRHVRSYNVPDATQARLAELSLSDLPLDGFRSGRLSYSVEAPISILTTTVSASATQATATIVIEPGDADADAETGHQVSLDADTIIAVTVTSADESRSHTYRVRVSKPPCLTGLTDQRLSDIVFVGGSIADLESCGRNMGVIAFFHHFGGTWTAYIIDAPAFLNRPFHQRFGQGVPVGLALIAARESAPDEEVGSPGE